MRRPALSADPLMLLKRKPKAYVVLLPGDYEGKDFLKQILRLLMLKLPKEQREKAGKTSIEQIREFVPYTKGAITEKLNQKKIEERQKKLWIYLVYFALLLLRFGTGY